MVGEPLPRVNIRWYSCNPLGQSCVERARQTGHYILQSSDRYRRIKAVVTMRNDSGTAGAETALSPIITN